MSTLRIQTGGMNIREGDGWPEQGVSLHLFVESGKQQGIENLCTEMYIMRLPTSIFGHHIHQSIQTTHVNLGWETIGRIQSPGFV
jgi:hypothetical protein